MDTAGQLSFLVEKGHNTVFWKPYHTAREALTSKMEIEAAKLLAKARIKQDKKGKGGTTASRED